MIYRATEDFIVPRLIPDESNPRINNRGTINLLMHP